MIKALYSAASAMLAGINRQKALAHNIANLDTPGFKQILLTMDDYVQKPVVSQTSTSSTDLPSVALTNPVLVTIGKTTDTQLDYLGDLGLGVEINEEVTDYSTGPIKSTGEDFDLAIHGEGFFRINTPQGERYTRDGRFHRDASGHLVTVEGYQVLNNSGQPITLPEGDFTVLTNGQMEVDGVAVGELGIAMFNDPKNELQRGENNTFIGKVAPTGNEPGTVQQGYLEASNANASEIMTQMISVTRAYESAQKVVQLQDELVGRSITTLGRVL
jgi:flagellar basal-body rod protein FlgF